MPGAQDGWGQLAEPGTRGHDGAHADLPRGADRPERGSLADLRQRLDRLPPGHPSSPYNDDLTRKPPVARLKDLELPFHDANGGARHHDPGPGADAPAGIADRDGATASGPAGNGSVGAGAPVAEEPSGLGAASGAEPADGLGHGARYGNGGRNGSVNGLGPDAEWRGADVHGAGDQFSADDRFSADAQLNIADELGADRGLGQSDELAAGDGFGTADEFGAGDGFGTADEFGAGDGFGAADGFGAGDGFGTADGFGPDDQPSPADGLGADDQLSPADEFGADRGFGAAEPLTASGEVAADGYGTGGYAADGRADPRSGTDGWLSAATWDATDLANGAEPGAGSDWDGTGWEGATDRDPGGVDAGGEPGWTDPEPGAGTLPRATDPDRDRVDELPRKGPDGSWEWNGRYLTPVEYQISEEALGRCRIAEGRNVFGGYGHSGLTPAMRRVEAQLESGGLLPDTENRALKPPDSFRERFADLILRHPDKPADELSLEVHDGIRYAFIFDAENYAEATLQAHSRLKGHGFELEARWNGWESREYKGINSRWRDPAHDLVFEVQFHTASSWDTWQRGRSSYRRITDPRTPPAERARLRVMHAQNSARVPVPPRCTAIPDFRKDVV